MPKRQKFALLTFSVVITVRGFSRDQKFLFCPLPNMERTFEYIQFPVGVSSWSLRSSMHLEMSNSKSFVPRESTNGLDSSKV